MRDRSFKTVASHVIRQAALSFTSPRAFSTITPATTDQGFQKIMTRVFGHYVALEMFGLWLLEFVPCLLAIYWLLAQDPLPTGIWIDVAALNHAAILALTIALTSSAIGLYRPEVCVQTRRLLVNSVVAGLLAFPAVIVVGWVAGINISSLLGQTPHGGYAIIRPLQLLLTWVLFLFATRLLFNLALRHDFLARRLIILGGAQEGRRISDAIRTVRPGFFRVTGVVSPAGELPVGETLMPAELRRQGIWGIVVTAEARGAALQEHLLHCKYAGVRIFSDIEFREQQLRRIDLEHLAPDWMLFADGLSRSLLERGLRRTGDIFACIMVLALTLPVTVLTALLIRLEDPGPVFYRQQRVGLRGQVFTLLKFRSMRVDAEARGPAWAVQRDPRVTRVGAFIRRTRIDELPQLVNVLRGEMSFVGPRPERPHFVAQLSEVIPFYRDRSSVRPGITGWAQVNFPYGASIEDAREKLSYDLYYVKHRSLFLDALILLATIRVVLFQEGSR